jgi:hypothetical protein
MVRRGVRGGVRRVTHAHGLLRPLNFRTPGRISFCNEYQPQKILDVGGGMRPPR